MSFWLIGEKLNLLPRYRDSPVAQSPESADEEEENTQTMPVHFEQQSAESSDDDNDRRGRQRCAFPVRSDVDPC